jgi:hypothetical protein
MIGVVMVGGDAPADPAELGGLGGGLLVTLCEPGFAAAERGGRGGLIVLVVMTALCRQLLVR